MGCQITNRCSINDQYRKSIIQSDSQKIYYNQLNHPIIEIFNDQSIIIELEGQSYLVYWKMSQLNILNIQTCNKNEFILQGDIQNVSDQRKCLIILTNYCLYRFQMVDDGIKIVQQIRIILKNEKDRVKILFYSLDFIIVTQQNRISVFKLSVSNKYKIIFRFSPYVNNEDFLYYDKEKGDLFVNTFTIGLILFNIQTKKIRFLSLRIPKQQWPPINIKYIKINQNNITVIFNYPENGLFLNKINYQNGIIETYEFLYYAVECNIYENNNILNLQSRFTHMTFDDDFKVQQKFETSFVSLIQQFDQSYGIWVGKSQAPYIFLISTFTSHEIPEQAEVRSKEIYIFKQKVGSTSGQVWIRDIKDYEVEGKYWDAKISQNQHYLAIQQQSKLLLFYLIEQKIEKQFFFQYPIKFFKLSFNSSQLCIIFHYQKSIFYFKCQQGLKQINKLFLDETIQLISSRDGICFSRDQKNRIRVFSQKAKKLIFNFKKFSKIKCGIDYCPLSGIFMIVNFKKLFFFSYLIENKYQSLIKYTMIVFCCRIHYYYLIEKIEKDNYNYGALVINLWSFKKYFWKKFQEFRIFLSTFYMLKIAKREFQFQTRI